MKDLALLWISLCLLNPLCGQETKQVNALKIQSPISIDGILDEPVYDRIQPATDRRKKLSFYFYYGHSAHTDTNQNRYSGQISASWRLGLKFNINYTLDFQNNHNQFGYTAKNDDESIITFAQRDMLTRQNILSLGYVMNNKVSIKLRARHYWSGYENIAFFQLQEDGSLNLIRFTTKTRTKTTMPSPLT